MSTLGSSGTRDIEQPRASSGGSAKVVGARAGGVQGEAEEVGLTAAGSNCSGHLPQGNHRENNTRLLFRVHTKRARDKNQKLHLEKFQLCTGKKFKVKVVIYQNRFPGRLWISRPWTY